MRSTSELGITSSVAAALKVRVRVGVGIHAHGSTDVGDYIVDTGAIAGRAGVELYIMTSSHHWRHVCGPHP